MASKKLIELAKEHTDTFDRYSVEQIVAVCGDGKLRDGSECAREFREFLRACSTDKLAEYARYCLETAFNGSGFVLQDVVNEIARRLGYEVENGRYRGVKNDIGFDGLWHDGSSYLVAEVKTTDTYRINLDDLAVYGEKAAREKGEDPRQISTLIIVGRQDTGDLEAQIRGSRHAWDIRLISVDALIKLMFVSEQLGDATLNDRVKRVLRPFEYTRVDDIVDLVFETQQDLDFQIQVSENLDDADEKPVTAEKRQGDDEKRKLDITPSDQLKEKRQRAVRGFFEHRGLHYRQKSQTFFSSSDDRIKVVCSVSKRYKRENQPYWYALHPHWLEYIENADEGFLILTCMDLNTAYALPAWLLRKHLPDLNSTVKKDGYEYWHIALRYDDDALLWNLSKAGGKIDITPYEFQVASSGR
jgi:hypothetical protein